MSSEPLTCQLVDVSTGGGEGAWGASAIVRPCWILRASTGETWGGYISEQTAMKAAEERGAALVEFEPAGWTEQHRPQSTEETRERQRLRKQARDKAFREKHGERLLAQQRARREAQTGVTAGMAISA